MSWVTRRCASRKFCGAAPWHGSYRAAGSTPGACRAASTPRVSPRAGSQSRPSSSSSSRVSQPQWSTPAATLSRSANRSRDAAGGSAYETRVGPTCSSPRWSSMARWRPPEPTNAGVRSSTRSLACGHADCAQPPSRDRSSTWPTPCPRDSSPRAKTGLEWIDSIADYEALVVRDDGMLLATPGFANAQRADL